MIAFILTEPFDETTKSTLIGILTGFVLGVILTYFFSWGILAVLGRKLIFKLGILILALFIGIIGAVVGDAKAAYKRPLTAGEIYRAKKVFGILIPNNKARF
jgi:high-affinity Fe2+/Pb2+ permease